MSLGISAPIAFRSFCNEADSHYLCLSNHRSAMKKKALLIDASTVDPIFAKRLAQQAQSAGARMVDAPVSGGMCQSPEAY